MPLRLWNRKKSELRENRNGSAQFSFCLIADSKMPDGLIAVRHFFIRADGRVLRLHSAFRILESAFGVGGIAQLVERQLCKLDVRGSNPLASSPEGFRGCHPGVKRRRAAAVAVVPHAPGLRFGRAFYHSGALSL
jgi:hypothetical protein